MSGRVAGLPTSDAAPVTMARDHDRNIVALRYFVEVCSSNPETRIAGADYHFERFPTDDSEAISRRHVVTIL
jgi:hypothetical protein